MKRSRWLILAVVFGFTTLAPSRASAQNPLPERQCVSSFLAACATLQYVDFSETWAGGTKGILRLVISNTSEGLGEFNAYISRLIFDLTGTLPEVQALALVDYGTYSGGIFTENGDSEIWNVKKTQKVPGDAPAGFQLDLEMKDSTKEEDGGVPELRADPGLSVMMEIAFDGLLTDVALGCEDPVDCQAWSAEMKGWGKSLKDSGYTGNITHSPEPASVFLLASGLIGLAAVGARRRKRGDPGE